MLPLLDALKSLPITAPDARLCVAYSGGLDSVALLHALANTWPGRVYAVHVHHGLHPQADAWAEHCRDACQSLGVTLQVVHVQVDLQGKGLEAAARQARHAAFAQVLQQGDLLVTAHHQDDQAETFLMRALRASGPDGLGAMRPLRPFAQGWLWRPWLSQPRSALLAYAQAHGLTWVEDPSNADNSLDRNFLRNQVLPLLRQRWPQAGAALARSATLSAQAAQLLSQQDAIALESAQTEDPHLVSVPALQKLDPNTRARLIRHWVSTLGLPPLPAQGITQLEVALLGPRHDGQAQFMWEDARLQRWRNWLHVGRTPSSLPAEWSEYWCGTAPLSLPDGGRLQLHGAVFDTPLIVSRRHGGERIQLSGRTHTHALKGLLQNADIPPWQRCQLPLLRDAQGEVLAAGDRILAGSFEAWLNTRGATLQWTPPPNI